MTTNRTMRRVDGESDCGLAGCGLVRGSATSESTATTTVTETPTPTFPRAIKSANAGNGPNTYWRPEPRRGDGRGWCVEVAERQYLRDAKGRVRRFGSRASAEKAATEAVKVTP